MNERTDWWTLATSPIVVRSAIKIALVVGSILALINHGDALCRGEFSRDRLLKILITYCVPYMVSTVSSVHAIQSINREQPTQSERDP